MDDNLVKIDFDGISAETDDAYLFRIAGKNYWIPKSQVSTVFIGKKVARITEWIAIKKGLV